MNGDKYIGLDVHQATISVAVLDSAGKLLMESVIETKAATILQFIQGLRGNLYVTFEEGTCAAWLYDLLKPHVTEVVVCDPRKNALLKAGNKSDRIDARKLAELLRSGLLSPVYQGEAEAGLRTLKELARSYLTTAKDLTRAMNRLKALYRSRAIFCVGRGVYAPHHRAEWLQRLPAAGARYSMPPRTTQESHRPRVSDRTMVGTRQPLRLSVSEPDGVVTNRKMKLLGWEKISSLVTSRDEPSSWDRKPEQNQNQNLLVRERGWMPARILPCAAVGGEIFLLTSPVMKTGFSGQPV